MSDFKYNLGDIVNLNWHMAVPQVIKCKVISQYLGYNNKNAKIYRLEALEKFNLSVREKEPGEIFAEFLEQNILPINNQQDTNKGDESPQDYFRRIMI